jgi:high-affinity Fe2+/Pb2+ permease
VRTARVRAEGRRSLITSGLTLLVSLGLFAWHWRWLRRRTEPASFVTAGARAPTDA